MAGRHSVQRVDEIFGAWPPMAAIKEPKMNNSSASRKGM